MKSYRDFWNRYIGMSDIASLTLRFPLEAKILNFGEDNAYRAYIVEGEAEIGSHYKLVAEGTHWLKVYDDQGLTAEFDAKTIRVYRAAEMGCIIQLIK